MIDTTFASRYQVFPHLTSATYVPHALHGSDSLWLEKNCYIDLWIELLHAQGLEPHAMLPFVVRLNFEGDQFTFFKPPLDDLRWLYGIDVQELTVWRTLWEHAAEHLSAGRLISTEADAFWLPDTLATDYRQKHTKTTIVLADLDLAAQRLGYFHNAGYYTLEGEDFLQTFRLHQPTDSTYLPLFAELIRLDRVSPIPLAELAERSRTLFKKHLSWRPMQNPIAAFADRFEHDLAFLQTQGLDYYHLWAFGSIRQLGAAFELAANYMKWLAGYYPDQHHSQAIQAFEQIAQGSKALILKGARAVMTKRPLDLTILSGLVQAWDKGMESLSQAPA